jgi:hypothetical protein
VTRWRCQSDPSCCILIGVISLNAIFRVLAATGGAALFALLVGGAPSGWDDPYLDVLLGFRKPVPVAEELLLMPISDASQRESPADPGPVDIIWTLAEVGAERVLLPRSWNSETVVGSRSSSSSAAGLSARLDREFDRIDENIATLFEAIRIGAIDPTEAERFVSELRRLVAESKTRIYDDPGDGAATQESSLDDLIATFGGDRVGMNLSDLGVSLPRYPSVTAEPIPPGGRDDSAGFRRLTAASIGRYISLSHRLAENLAARENEGYFDELAPADRPRAILARVRELRGGVSAHPSLARVKAWRAAVDGYNEAVGALIAGEAQALLTARFEALEGATEGLEEETAAQIREMRQEFDEAFTSLRADYVAVVAARRELSAAVAGSFVVLQDDIGDDDRVAAVNSALVGEHLRAPFGWTRTALLAAIGLLVGLLLSPFSFRTAIALSPAGLLVGAMAFPVLFLVGDVWVEPGSAVGALFAATGATLLVAGLFAGRVERVLAGRGAYRLPPHALRRVTRRGYLPMTETGRRPAVAVVVAREAKDRSRAVDLPSFQRAVSQRIRQVGGVILGEDGFTVVSAFPAPAYDRARSGTALDPADTRLASYACSVVKELVAKPLPGGVAIRCGVELGDLLFYLSPIGGYRASGRALRYAHRFCDLARTYRHPALFGESVVAACGPGGDAPRFQEAGQLVLATGGGRFPFYRLTETDPPSP